MPDKRSLQRGGKKPRRTLLKMRVTPLVRMPKSVLFARIRSACRDGIVPRDIAISTLNWDHARGGRYLPGQRLSGRDQQELRNCYQLLTGMGTEGIRFEQPS